MKIIVIGATGTIGKAVADQLALRHDVIRASRKSETQVDIRDYASVAALFDRIKNVDAVVSCGGDVEALQKSVMGPLEKLSDEQFQFGFRMVLDQINLVRSGMKFLRDGGSITLTTGAISTHPRPGSTVASMLGASIESFIRSASLETPRGLRINAVSPGWVKETMEKFGMDSTSGMPAKTLADFYALAVEGNMNGQIIEPTV